MKFSWRDVAQLLDGSSECGKVAASTLADIICLAELQDVISGLCSSYAISDNTATRKNAALALQLLCQRFSSDIQLLMNSDGKLLDMNDIQLIDILEKGSRLYNTDEPYDLPSATSGPKWIIRQRAILMRKLGKNSEDMRMVSEYSGVDNIIELADVNTSSRLTNASASDTPDSNLSQDASMQSAENWFVRTLRDLISGILHCRWKCRHGSCLALVAIVEGMGWIKRDIATRSAAVAENLRLPAFLAEDVLTSCISVLVLDRYMDVSGDDTSPSLSPTVRAAKWQPSLVTLPVTEAAAELICVVSASQLQGHGSIALMEEITAHFFSRAVSTAIEMSGFYCSEDRDMWRVSHSGLVLLKHMLRHQACLSRMCESVGVFQSAMEAVSEALRQSHNDDIRGSAAEALAMGSHLMSTVAIREEDVCIVRCLRLQATNILLAIRTVIPTASGVIASSLLAASADGLYHCLHIWQLIHHSSYASEHKDSLLVIALALEVGGDILDRFVQLDCSSSERDVDLTHALPVVLNRVLQMLRATDYLDMLLSVESCPDDSPTVDGVRVIRAATRIFCKLLAAPLLVGVSDIDGICLENVCSSTRDNESEKDSIAFMLSNSLSIIVNANLYIGSKISDSHLILSELLTTLLDWYFSTEFDTETDAAVVSDAVVVPAPVLTGARNKRSHAGKSSTSSVCRPAPRRLKKQKIDYCDVPDDDDLNFSSAPQAHVPLTATVDGFPRQFEFTSCVRLYLTSVSFSGDRSGVPVVRRAFEAAGGIYFARVIGFLVSGLTKQTIYESCAQDSLQAVIKHIQQQCSYTFEYIAMCIDTKQSDCAVKFFIPEFHFSDPGLVSRSQSGPSNIRKSMQNAVRSALRLSWTSLQALHTLSYCSYSINAGATTCCADALMDSIVTSLTELSLLTQQSTDHALSCDINSLSVSVLILTLRREFARTRNMETIRSLITHISPVQGPAREFYISVVAETLQMHKIMRLSGMTMEKSDECDFSAEDIFDVVNSIDMSTCDAPTPSGVSLIPAESRLILDILSSEVDIHDICIQCNKRIVLHGGVSSAQAPVPSHHLRKCAEVLIAIMSKKQQACAIDIELMINCATDPLSFGFIGEKWSPIRLAILRFLAVYLHYVLDYELHLSVIRCGGLRCIIDIVVADLCTEMSSPIRQDWRALPDYDALHRHDDDTTICKCDWQGNITLAYSGPVLVSALVALMSLTTVVMHADVMSTAKNNKTNIVMSSLPDLIMDSLQDYGGVTNYYAALSLLFLHLVEKLREITLVNYKKWVSVALYGIGHHGGRIVRSNFTSALRILVPLAPLLANQPDRTDAADPSAREEVNGPGKPDAAVIVSDAAVSDMVDEVLVPAPRSTVEGLSHTTGIDKSREASICQKLAQMMVSKCEDGDCEDVNSSPDMDLSSCLRPYQLEGINWILQLWRCGLGAVLADDMGLGKTVQTIASLALRRGGHGHSVKRPSLVVCPAMLVHHWVDEVRKFVPSRVIVAVKLSELIDNGLKSRDNLEQDITDIGGGPFSEFSEEILAAINYMKIVGKLMAALQPHQLLVVSYDLLRKICQQSLLLESTNNNGHCGVLLHRFLFDVVVADESHCLRNPKTELYRCMISLQARCRIALTGTPVQNRIDDVWGIINWSIPDFLGNYKDFRKNVVTPIRKAFAEKDCQTLALSTVSANGDLRSVRQTQEVAEGLRLLRNLHKQIIPFILRRTKDTALTDLPPKIIIDVFCPLSNLQRFLYAQFQKGLQISDTRLEQELIEIMPPFVSSMIKSETKASKLCDITLENLPRPIETTSYHPFQAISYLKRLCVHPSLIIEQVEPSQQLFLEEDDGEIFSSGKLCKLVDILVEQQVVTFADSHSQLRMQRMMLNRAPVGSCTLVKDVVLDTSDSDSTSSLGSTVDEDDPNNSDDCSNESDTAAAHDRLTHPVLSQQSPRKKKCLIFAEHRATLDVIREYVFDKYFPHEHFALLDGRVAAQTRAHVVEAFNSKDAGTDSPTVLLLTVGSCGLGLNLSAAEMVVFVEHSWNPFVDLQAMDRVHRIGQLRTTTVYRLLAESTIETRIRYLQHMKTVVADKILGNGEIDGPGDDLLSNIIIDNLSSDNTPDI